MLLIYQNLIQELPVRALSFRTQRSTWRTAEAKIDWLSDLNDQIFGSAAYVDISRQDIFNVNTELRLCIIKTLYWGYPSGMRGQHFPNILSEIETVEEAISTLKETGHPTTEDYQLLMKKLKMVTGLALSTISKLLYFFEIRINGHDCQILDLRLIDSLSSKSFSQYQKLLPISYGAVAEKKYPLFLEITTNIAHELGCKGENIEMFLFTFGKNLKPYYPISPSPTHQLNLIKKQPNYPLTNTNTHVKNCQNTREI